MKTVADYLISFLEEKGIKRIYGVTGGMIMYLTEAIRKSNIKFIPMLQEQGAGIAAEAESIYKNDISVLLTTSGPGILNVVNPIASAYIDGNPMLIIAGQCKTTDSMYGTNLRTKGIQEVNAIEILKPITKYTESLKKAKDIRYELERSFQLINKNRKGPVFLEIPLDIQNIEIDEYGLDGFNWDIDLFDDVVDIEKINKLVELLNNSKKPVILAGNGIRQSGALEDFIEKISKVFVLCIAMPLLLTWKFKDFCSNNAMLYFGIPGSIASRYANKILQECDLLISIGARIDLPTCAFNYKNFARNAKKIIVDIDKAEIDKLEFEKELIFNCDAKMFIEKFHEICLLDKNKLNKIVTSSWIYYCKGLKEKYPICLPEYYKEKNFVNPYVFINELSKYSDNDDIIVAASSGSASEMMAQAFRIKEGQRYISSNGLGSMGFGICHSIGASFASDKKKRVICVEGDGSFFMNVQHLQTIKQYNLPIIIFVWNNGEYKSIRETHLKFFGEKIGCDEESGLTLPNLERIAKSYGIDYFKFKNNNHIISSLDFVLTKPLTWDKRMTSMICEVMTDPNFQTQPRVQSYVDKNGNICSGKLEDIHY